MAGKSWRDYSTDETVKKETSSEKTGSWRDYSTDQSAASGKSSGGWRDYSKFDITGAAASNVTSKVNAWLKNHNSYLSDYNKRYSGRKYSYDDAYVSDSGSWLETVNKRVDDFEAERQEILSYLDQYSDYLDAKWVNSIRDTLSKGRDAQLQLQSAAQQDNEYWMSFSPNEEQAAAGYTADKIYQEWQTGQKQYADDMAFDLAAGTKEIEDLEAQRLALLQELDASDSSIGTANVDRAAMELVKNIETLEKQIQEKKSHLDRVKYVQGYEGYMDNINAADYAANSKYVSTRTDVAKEDALWGFPANRYDESKLFGDFLHDYINRNEDALGVASVNNTASNASFLGLDQGFLQTMSDDEIGVYNYLYNTQGKEAANAFLSHIESDLEGRKRAQEQEYWANYAKESPVGSSVFSTLISPLKGLSYLGQAADMLDDGKMDQNAGYNRFSYIPSTIRSQVSTTIENSGKWGKVGSFAYNTGMSMADFLFTTAVSGGNQGLSLAIMGTGAAADATIAAKERGLDDDQAFTIGTIAGLAEVAMEKISLGAWLDGDMTEGALKYMLKNALSEGAEEAGTSVINLLADVIIAGDKSEWNMAMQAYIAEGKSPEEAFGLVAAEQAAQIGLDALGGALSGTAIGGGTYAGSSVAAGVQYSDIARDKTSSQKLVTEGLELNPNSQYVQKMQSKMDKGKSLTGMQVRNILAANKEQVTANDMKTIQQAAEKRLTDLGQTKDVQKLAEIATKWATGQDITRAEKSLLANSEYGARVANELLPENIASGDFSTEWAEEIGTKEVNKMAYNKKAIRSILDSMVNAEDAAAYKSLEERVGTDSRFGVSESGQATIRESGEEISLDNVEVVKTEDGQMTVKLADGREVYAGDIDFADDTQAYAFSAVADIENITPAAATAIIRDIDFSKSVGEQLNGIDEAYTYGFHGYSVEDLKAGNFAPNLSTEQMMSAYKLGQSARKISDVSKTDAIKRMRTAVEAEAEKAKAGGKEAPKAKKMTITYNNGNGKIVDFDKAGIKLTTKQKAAPAFAQVMHEMGLGTNFELYSSYLSKTMKDKNDNPLRVRLDENGEEVAAPSGIYRKSDGTVCIDLNAYNGKQLTLDAMSHELTHFIQQWSDEKYKVLAEFLVETYEKTDMSMHQRVLREQARLESIRGKEVSYNEAYNEVVANAMSKMLADGKVMERLNELRAKDKNLAEKLWEGLKKLLNKFFRIYENEAALFHDAADLMELKAEFEQMQKMWAEAFVEASENFQAAQTIGFEMDMETESIAPAVMHSEQTWTESDYVQQRDKAAQEIAKAIGVTEKKAKDYIDSVNSIAKMIAEDRSRLDYFSSPGRSSFVDNAEYGGSFDFSTLCKKRRLLTGTFTAIQKALPNTALTADEILDIRNRMKKAGLEVSCGLCYVEGSRANMGQFAKEFLRLYKQYYPDAWQPNMADVNTPDGIEWVRINHPECYEQYEYFWNHYGTLKDGDKNLFASQQKPKLYQLHTEYKGEILNKFKNDDKVEDKNLNGGIRLQSFSDFEIVHLIDTMQIIMDMSRVGLAGQAYTKVPDFAWALGDTGLKINLSLIAKGVDANGNLIFDDVEGMPIAEAMKLRDRYSKNVGTILVAFNDEQLLAAMADDRVDFIIPFHRSQWKKSQYEAMGLPAKTKDYTFMQNEKFIKPQFHEYRGRMVKDKATNYMPNEYWDFSKSGKENAEAYLEMCARNNKRPKFYKLLQNNGDGSYSLKADGSTDGYWKLLIDFKMYDNEGNGSPQMAVKPEFNMEEATRMLNGYSGGHSNFPVAQGVVDGFVKDYKDSHKGVMYSSQETDLSEEFDYSDLNWATDLGIITAKDRGIFERTINNEIFRGAKPQSANGEYIIDTGKCLMFTDGDFHNPKLSRVIVFATEYESLTDYAKRRIIDEAEATGEVHQSIQAIESIFGEGFVSSYAQPDGYTYAWQNRGRKGSNGSGSSQTTRAKSIKERLTEEGKEHLLYSSQETDADNAPTFYSQMGKVVEGMKQEKFGASSVISMLRGRGVKAEEIRWSGIQAFLDGKKSVTKAELLEFIKGSMLHIEEKLLDSSTHGKAKLPDNYRLEEYATASGDPMLNLYIDGELVDTFEQLDDDSVQSTGESQIWAMDEADLIGQILNHYAGMSYGESYGTGKKAPKWGGYKLDGGENYREMLFKMPGATYTNPAMKAHWGEDETGVLAHARIQDFINEHTGVKMLFIEEIQSDWHNAGQKAGYLSEDESSLDSKAASNAVRKLENDMEAYLTSDEAHDLVTRYMEFYDLEYEDRAIGRLLTLSEYGFMRVGRIFPESIVNSNAFKKMREYAAKRDALIEEADRVYHLVNGKAQDAPFKGNYHEYVLKRLLRMAAEEGYDSIGWTTADIQSKRWSSKYAEGYRIEYDHDIPKFLKKYGKQWGADVGKTKINDDGTLPGYDGDPNAKKFDSPEEAVAFLESLGFTVRSTENKAFGRVYNTYSIFNPYGSYGTQYGVKQKDMMELADEYHKNGIHKKGVHKVWYMDITPAMKKSVMKEGQALYSTQETDYSNRDLLANAFEGITQNSVEYKLIQEYKSHIKELNELEAKLSDLNAEIRKIRFGTDGARDTQRLAQLESEAKEVAKEINRYDKRLLSLEASEPLRKVIERERKKEAQKTKAHVEEIQQNKKVRAEQAELRHKIRKTIRDLDKILNRGNKKLNVKEDVQNVVTKALQAADILFTDNFGTYDMLRSGIKADLSDAEEALVESCTKMLKDLDKMPTDGYENWQARQEAENRLKTKMSKLKDVFARERKRLNNTTVSSILGELADAYASLEKSEQSYVQGAYTEAVHNFLKNLQSEVGGTIVKDMTKDQLESVYAAYKMVLTTVRKANQMFNEELKQSREQLGNAVIQEVRQAGGVHLLGTKMGDTISQASWNNMKPVWVGNRIGSDTFGKLMNGLFKGQYNFAVDIDEAKRFKLEMDGKYHPREWDAEKQYKFESSTGKEFSLNLQQIMSLYAFSKREQAYSHLLNGGFVFENNSTVIVEEDGRKKTYIHKGATSYKLNEATLNSIISSLTKEQKAYVDEMQKYLSEVMGEKGNEVSMQLYGIRMFKEQFYFPLRSSGAYMERAKEAEMKKQQGQINLVNSGFTHAVKPEAKNPIILSGFMDVWAEHCNEMSMYHSMVLPMEDFRKVYNYSTVHDDKFDSASVFQTIQDAYGDAATNYIDQLYRELNAGATIDPRETPFKKLISNFKKTAVMLSASVVVQQFSSIGRAYALVDPKYFVGAKVNSDTKLSVADEMRKYAPVAIIKEMGGFDTGTKGSAKAYIMAEQYGKGERIQGLLKDDQYRSDIMGYLPAKADEKTWCAIWEAVKRETKAKNPKMDIKSEEFLKLAGERFSEVIEKTQVYDSVLARSANMRSKTGLMQMATSFMAEPTTTVNLLEDAIRSGNKAHMARAFGAVAVSIVLNNALASIVYAMRDDDEDETFIEKYFQSFTSGMIDDINPMSYYPFLKDVYSLFQGYDVERADMSVIADLRDALKKVVGLLGKDTSGMDDNELAAHNKQVNEVFLGLLDAGCSVFGVPFKNVRRDANGLINAFSTVGKDLSGERNTTWLSFWDKVGAAAKDTIPGLAWTKDKAKTDKLYDAIVSGDKSYLSRLKSTYKTDSAYQSAVRTALRENDPRIHEAAKAKYEGKADEYKRIFREIQKEGKFTFDDIMSAINSEESKIRNGLEPDKVTSSYTASDFVEAVAMGNASEAKAMMENIISTKVANGKTQEEAEKEFASNVSTGIGEAYAAGLLDETGAKNMLVEYAGKDEEEAASKVRYWDFCNAHPEYDLNESQVGKYQEFAEPADIPLDVFVQYINGTKGLVTEYDEWGDVDVTKREQVLEVIDSLPLTWQQKDALYLAAGYSESKIWDVPW